MPLKKQPVPDRILPRIIGNLSPLVAVFVMGQAWQFKNWPWGGNPTVIFSKICAVTDQFELVIKLLKQFLIYMPKIRI